MDFLGGLASLLGGGKKPRQQLATQQPPAKPITGTFDALTAVGDVAGRINDNTYGAAIRAGGIFANRASQIPTRIAESLNPNDDESRGKSLLNKAAGKLGFSPNFTRQIIDANPVLSSGPLDAEGVLTDGTEAAGLRHPAGNLHRIRLSDKYGDLESSLRHEGLHDTYSTLKPEQIKSFNSLAARAFSDLPSEWGVPDGNGVSQIVTPGLRSWLDTRTNGYKATQDSPLRAESVDVNSLPISLQDELHAYVPEYFDATKRQMPDYLADYYANYYNTGGRPTGLQQKNGLEQLLGRIFR